MLGWEDRKVWWGVFFGSLIGALLLAPESNFSNRTRELFFTLQDTIAEEPSRIGFLVLVLLAWVIFSNLAAEFFVKEISPEDRIQKLGSLNKQVDHELSELKSAYEKTVAQARKVAEEEQKIIDELQITKQRIEFANSLNAQGKQVIQDLFIKEPARSNRRWGISGIIMTILTFIGGGLLTWFFGC